MDTKAKQVILASASPRRKQLIAALFDNVLYMPQDVDESVEETNPDEIVKALSVKKLNDLDKEYNDALIISADTIVYFNNKVYGKPKDAKDAVRILKELSDNKHYVYSGVCVAYKSNRYVFSVRSEVVFKKLDEKTIEKYIQEKNPLDKAGAYGIQDEELVLCYTGSYTNIVGLPMEELAEKLKMIGAI